MRNALVAALCVFVLPAIADARQAPAQSPPPMPSIGLPLPPIGLPLGPIGLDTSRDQPNPPATAPAHDGRPRRGGLQRPIVIFGAPYAFGVDPLLQSYRPGYIVPVEPPAAPVRPTTGTLRLHVEPFELLQVFVDGEYVGTPNDFQGELELDAGTRQIELRARGYETFRFDVRILAGRAISYRGSLEPLKPREPGKSDDPAKPDDSAKAAAGPDALGSPKTVFYLIPGCYIGNVPPDQVKLPPGCDPSRVITHRPGTP